MNEVEYLRAELAKMKAKEAKEARREEAIAAHCTDKPGHLAEYSDSYKAFVEVGTEEWRLR